jgi:hypothetical protein
MGKRDSQGDYRKQVVLAAGLFCSEGIEKATKK